MARRDLPSTRILRLRNALKAIRDACERGVVCDDVARFDEITTLTEFCTQILDTDVTPRPAPAMYGATHTKADKQREKSDG